MATASQIGSNGHETARSVGAQVLVLGFVALNTMFWLAIELDGYPMGAGAPVALTTAVGVMAYLLLRRGFGLGYAVAAMTGILGLISIVLIVAGPHGPPPEDPASPQLFAVFGPVAYAALAASLIIAAGVAWRGGQPSTSGF